MWIVRGKNSIVPTVSPVSVIACAHCPIRKLIAHVLLPRKRQRSNAITKPYSRECVKPTRGQPRWNCTGSEAFRSQPPMWMPYTNHLLIMSGEYEPISSGTNAIFSREWRWIASTDPAGLRKHASPPTHAPPP